MSVIGELRGTDGGRRLSDVFEAAVLLEAKDRSAFLDEVCEEDLGLRAEVEVLLADRQHLLGLALADRRRLVGLFHAAFALSPDDRPAFFERACADRSDEHGGLERLLAGGRDPRRTDGSSRVDEVQRKKELFEAALLLEPAGRSAFLGDVCGDEPHLRSEIEMLLARASSLGSFEEGDRSRISGLLHVALALPPHHRGAFLDKACAHRPHQRHELDSLLKHAADSTFLERPVATDGSAETSLQAVATDSAAASLVGRKVRDYVILEKLGEGGMGVVYRALDTQLEKHVAIKVIKPEHATDPDYRRLLVREAQLAAKLSHPNIATVYVLFPEGRDLFLVSEYVSGPSLREVVDRGPLSYPRLVDIFTGVARGLAAAHAKQIIHRDLKPDNILLSDEMAKIVDFGIARSMDRHQTTSVVVGTLAYMAPEQLKCQHGQPLDFRCDLFAFGATLYEAATGINPFEGSSPETTMFNIMNVEPPALSKHRTDLGRLTPIVTRCLCKDPLRRPSSTEDLVRALEQLGPATTLPLTPVPDRSWWEVHQLAMAAFYAGALTLLWAVHALARPLWASQALTLASLLTGVLLIGVRLHYWFALRYKLSTFQRTRLRYRRAVRMADWALSVIFAAMAGLMVYVDRLGTAAPLLIIAAANVLIFTVVEPGSEDDAFPPPT